MEKWKRTVDKLPPESGKYLTVYVIGSFKFIDILTYHKRRNEFTRRDTTAARCYTIKNVTHWKKLPKLPKEYRQTLKKNRGIRLPFINRKEDHYGQD